MDVTELSVIQIAKEYPITPKEHGIEFLMDRRHLWLRSSRQHAILRVRHQIIKAIREFFDSRGFTLLDAPIFTPAACEGTQHAVRNGLLRPGKGLPHPVRPIVCRSRSHGARESLRVRSDLPGGKVKDPAASDGVLDGGARGRIRTI